MALLELTAQPRNLIGKQLVVFDAPKQCCCHVPIDLFQLPAHSQASAVAQAAIPAVSK